MLGLMCMLVFTIMLLETKQNGVAAPYQNLFGGSSSVADGKWHSHGEYYSADPPPVPEEARAAVQYDATNSRIIKADKATKQ